jgi:hypothetical protein
MKKTLFASIGAAALTLAAAFHLQPGSRIVVLAHNAYPDHGKYGDRLDRVIGIGQPFVVEQDLSWIEGKSLMIHGAKNVGSDDPSLESYFFPKVKPMMEKALRDGNKGNWPLVTVYLDIKNDPLDHLQAIDKTLDQYSAWLTTAVKPADGMVQTPLDIKPMMVLVEDKQNDIKEDFFYGRVPVGGKIRVFGTATKAGPKPGVKLSKAEAVDYMATLNPADVITGKANSYRRWVGLDWAIVEKGGESNAGDWTAEEATRLKKFVDYGHKMGYFVSLYCLDGFTEAENQGWDKDYNFGSKEAAMIRWKAAIAAKPDFISTDQYEELAKAIQSKH